MKVKWFAIIVFALVVFGELCLAKADSLQSTVTFSRDIAPIFYEHCAACHRQGNIGPMPLLTYRDAKPWARRIGSMVSSRVMPPWHADPDFGKFANDRRLSQDEIDKIVSWARQGAPEGDSRDLPPQPDLSQQSEIGQADVVLSMNEEASFGSVGVDQYLYFRIPTTFREDKWVQAVEFRPGNRKIVHHAVAFIETPQNYAETQRLTLSSTAKAPAWTLLDTEPASIELMEGTTRRVKADAPVVNDGCSAQDRDAVGVTSNPDVLSVYAPGKEADRWPDGVAKRIPAGSNIILQMHYSKLSGKPEKDRTSVALVFASKPVGNMVGTRSVSNDLFLIPPGAENHEVRACWTFQRDLELISFMPHMHVRGKSMKYELVYPDGRLETALSVPNYSFHWQTQYTLQHPLPVPAGTRLIVTAHYDNSDRNMHNPDPTRAVRHGTATFDEMMIGFVNYVIPKPHDHIVVRLDPRVFDKYVGKYEMEPGVVLEIIKVGDKLFADAGGQKIQLLPASETVFFSKATDSELTFLKNGQGETIEFTVTLNDKRSRFKKIN